MATELQAVPCIAGFTTDYDGLCVVSPTEGVLETADIAWIGRGYDIMRSRAQKVPETPVFVAL
jgi:hypothetical protein